MPSPSDEEFERLVRRSVATLPAPIAAAVQGLVVRVLDEADSETLRHMGIDDPLDLLGLYHGVSLDRKSAFDTTPEIDSIFLYRRPILAFVEDSGEALEDVVHHVVIHEIGHHFGFSDDDMDDIEHGD